MPLAALPLTPNGKLDRKALPTPEEQAEESVAFEAPKTPQEQLLAQLWSEILGPEIAHAGLDAADDVITVKTSDHGNERSK